MNPFLPVTANPIAKTAAKTPDKTAAAEAQKLKDQEAARKRDKEKEEIAQKDNTSEKTDNTTERSTTEKTRGSTETKKDSYPVATRVPGKENCVLSPYNSKLIRTLNDDDTPIPSGSLVRDPSYPASEKKFFRVP